MKLPLYCLQPGNLGVLAHISRGTRAGRPIQILFNAVISFERTDGGRRAGAFFLVPLGPGRRHIRPWEWRLVPIVNGVLLGASPLANGRYTQMRHPRLGANLA